ncbi:MAG: hypothetical protein PUH44_08325 [Bacteroidales bacterium]|nr:hypothetical protein [Bacteroidales bacterium]MDY2705826.1 hypothetical protein [Alloprevotella sp.]MDY2915432.1 hypothetical protein [Alloprevotella sp.]
MKRYLLTLLIVLAGTLSAKAISYNEARDRAWFLTDKMAYELNLTPDQYDRVYQVNLDYFMSIAYEADCYGVYWNYRDTDLRYILWDWQYRLYVTLDYFYRPIRWIRAAWHYPICDHYRYGYYYYERPRVYVSYHGCNWKRRGHNDVSPYRGWRAERGPGMRDRYDNNRPGGRPGTHNEPSRPSNGRYDGNHNNKGGRVDRGNTDNKGGRVVRNDHGSNSDRNVGTMPGRDRSTTTTKPSRDRNVGTMPSRNNNVTFNRNRNTNSGAVSTPSRNSNNRNSGNSNHSSGRSFGR